MQRGKMIALFQPSQTAFLGVLSVLFTGSLLEEPVCRWWDEDADLEMDKVTAVTRSDQPLAATAIGSQELEVRHHFVDVFLCQLFLDGLQATFNLSVV